MQSTDATISAFACLWELCVYLCVSLREGVCWWSCLKESSSDGAWKPCSAAVLPVHRQLHCWAHNTRSALTPARTLSSSLWIFLSLSLLSLHPLSLLIQGAPSKSLHSSSLNGSRVYCASVSSLISTLCLGHVLTSQAVDFPSSQPQPPFQDNQPVHLWTSLWLNSHW